MKRKRKIIKPDYATLLAHLIIHFRKYNPVKGNSYEKPLDRLLNLEFQQAAQLIARIEKTGLGLINKDNRFLGAYLLYQWIKQYAAGLSLLSELPDEPQKVLDLSFGASPFSLAACQHRAYDVSLCNNRVDHMELAAGICGKEGHTLSIRKWDYHPRTFPLSGQFDVIILGHTLSQLYDADDHKQKELVLHLFKYLSADGHILIVEDSFKENNARILQLRDQLIEKNVKVQAPCFFKGACPALNKNQVCFAQRPFSPPKLLKDLERKASIKSDSIKISYLLLKYPKSDNPHFIQNNLYRVTSTAMDSYNGIRFLVCGPHGTKFLQSHFKNHPQESIAFQYLRRGDIISIEDALSDNQHLRVIEGTKLKLIAPVGKPVPETPLAEMHYE